MTERGIDEILKPLARAELVKLDIDRLLLESGGCIDPERLTVIKAEIDVRLESLREIRRQQIIDEATARDRPAKRRWWRRA